MKWALVGVPALVLAAACSGAPAQALPAGPPRATTAAAPAVPLLPVRWHVRRYRHQAQLVRAADPEPAAAGVGGAVTDPPQHITGRYLRPCLQPVDSPMTPSRALPAQKAPPNAPSDSASGLVEPAAAAPGALPSAASPESAETAAPPPQPLPRMRYAQHRRYRYHRYYRRWLGGMGAAMWSGGSGFGPAPYSSSGP